ncbi:non-heme chloroperoxidase [Microdochium nivale]|nr:non-heme chloroperoxidase [Microdochium nivale]
MPYGRLSRDGHSLFYTVQGPEDGIPVIFIHGFSCDSPDWSFQVPFLLEKYTRLRLITLDSRNHGFSQYDDGSSPSSTSQKLDMATTVLAADAAALLVDLGASDSNRAIVMGHSLGGVVATELGHSYPQLVRGLVILDAAHFSPPGTFAQILEALRGPDGGDALAAYFENVYTPGTPAYLKTWHALRARGLEQDVAVAALQEMIDYIGDDNVELIRRTTVAGVPRLVVVSAPAFLEPLEQAGSESPEVDDFVVMEDGHWMMKSAVDKFNEILAKWLDKRFFF